WSFAPVGNLDLQPGGPPYVDEAHPVLRAGPVLGEGRGVHVGDVALVRLEVVRRMLTVEVDHDPVAGDLGDDRRRADAGGHPISLPHREPGYAEPVDGEAVGEDVLRWDLEQGDRATQRLDVRDVHAEPITLVGLDDHDR